MLRHGLVLLLLAGSFAGCAEVEIDGLQRAEAAPPPYFKEYRASVAPDHAANYSFDVGSRAQLVNVTVRLEAEGGGLPVPGFSPARLHVTLLDADGVSQAAADVDARAPNASLLVETIERRGAWSVVVDGFGASGAIEGVDYGASYVLGIEVVHA